jgi:hypothetical protein
VAFLRAGATQRIRTVASITFIVLLLLSTTGVAGWLFSHIPPDPTRVSTLADTNNPGSLRYAVDESPPNSTITFDARLRGTILLTSGDLNIARDLKILGPGAGILSISSGKSGHGIHVLQEVFVTFSGLTFKDSKTSEGFILNDGTITLNNSTISGNTTTDGSGIYNSSGTITLNNSTVSGNTATGGAGGGIFNISDSSNGSTLTLTNSTISDNTATGSYGGGIFIQNYDVNSSVHVDLTFSTIYDNTAHGGGNIAIENINSNGKAVKQVSHVKISNCIVVSKPAHPGPDISGTLISYGYNLFQNNSGATFDPATRIQHGIDKMLSVNDLTRLFADPVRLQNNGGPTKTLALAPDSPAVDQIPLAACHITVPIYNLAGTPIAQDAITTDQRGVKRPDRDEDRCDIGAYEYADAPT